MGRRQWMDAALRSVMIAVMVFFIIWGTIAIVVREVFWIFDRFFSAFLALMALVFYRRMRLSAFSLMFGLAVLIMHHLNLYGNYYFSWPFDRYMHFFGGLAVTLFFAQYLYHSQGKRGIAVAFLSVTIAAGLGAYLEIIEFVGYATFGEGEGLLFYGTGDIGEWNNISWDLISNVSGGLVGSAVFLLVRHIRDRRACKRA